MASCDRGYRPLPVYESLSSLLHVGIIFFFFADMSFKLIG